MELRDQSVSLWGPGNKAVSLGTVPKVCCSNDLDFLQSNTTFLPKQREGEIGRERGREERKRERGRMDGKEGEREGGNGNMINGITRCCSLTISH